MGGSLTANHAGDPARGDGVGVMSLISYVILLLIVSVVAVEMGIR